MSRIAFNGTRMRKRSVRSSGLRNACTVKSAGMSCASVCSHADRKTKRNTKLGRTALFNNHFTSSFCEEICRRAEVPSLAKEGTSFALQYRRAKYLRQCGGNHFM